MPATETFDDVFDAPSDHAEDERIAQRAKPAKRASTEKPAEPQTLTVQDEWCARLCRYKLAGLKVQYDGQPWLILESNFIARDGSTPDLLLWLIPPDKADSFSLMTDLRFVPASKCTLLDEWKEVCCRVNPKTTRCKR